MPRHQDTEKYELSEAEKRDLTMLIKKTLGIRAFTS